MLRSFLELSVSLVLVDLMAAVTFCLPRSPNYRPLDVSFIMQAADAKKEKYGDTVSMSLTRVAHCLRRGYVLTSSSLPANGL